MRIIFLILLCMTIIGCVVPGEPGSVESVKEPVAPAEPVQEPVAPVEPVKEPETPKVEVVEPSIDGNVKLYKLSKYAQIEISTDDKTESFILKTTNKDEIMNEVIKRYDIKKENINLSFSDEEREAEKPKKTKTQQILDLMNLKVKSYTYIKEDLPFTSSKVRVKWPHIKIELKEPEGTEYFKRRSYATDPKEEVREKAKTGTEYFVNMVFIDKIKGESIGVCTLFELYVSCEWLEGTVQDLPWEEFGIKVPGDWLRQYKDKEPTRFIEAGGYINGVDTKQLIFEEGDRTTRIWTHSTFGVPQQVEIVQGKTRHRVRYENMILNNVRDEEVAKPVPYEPEK